MRCELGGELAMKLVVGYLATPGGADAMALGARLARTLGADVEACIIMPVDRMLPLRTGAQDYEAKLTEQAQKWLAEALASVPDDIKGYGHIKDTHLEKARKKEAELLHQWRHPEAMKAAAE